MFNLYNDKNDQFRDIYTEIERFKFVPKRFEGELGFHIVRKCQETFSLGDALSRPPLLDALRSITFHAGKQKISS